MLSWRRRAPDLARADGNAVFFTQIVGLSAAQVGLGLTVDLSDPDRLGEYQGAAHIGHTLGSVWAPAVFTFLAMGVGHPGWIVIAAIVVLAVAGMGPAARASERFLQRDPRPVAADAPA